MENTVNHAAMKKLSAWETFVHGDTFEFGRWVQTPGEGPAPIVWLVLHAMDGQVLCMTRDCLITSGYCDPDRMVPGRENKAFLAWENCLARERLNQEFLTNAFTEDEQELMLDKKMPGGVLDPVFLLSEKELDRYLPEREERLARPTAQALADGARPGWNGYEQFTSWWLLPYKTADKYGPVYPKAVFHMGKTQYHARNVGHSDFTLRPCIILDMTKYVPAEEPEAVEVPEVISMPTEETAAGSETVETVESASVPEIGTVTESETVTEPEDEYAHVTYTGPGYRAESEEEPAKEETSVIRSEEEIPAEAAAEEIREPEEAPQAPEAEAQEGTEETFEGCDMIANLTSLPEEILLLEGCKIKRAFAGDKETILEFVNTHFQRNWVFEVEHAILQEPSKCFIVTRDGEVLGFACYDSTARGYFGPIGVHPEMRGFGLGKALLLRTLHAMREYGYGYAIIGWVGDAVDFYAKAVGATFIPNAAPRNTVYSNMVMM